MHPETGTSAMIVAHWFLKAKRTNLRKRLVSAENRYHSVTLAVFCLPALIQPSKLRPYKHNAQILARIQCLYLCRPFSPQNKSQRDVPCKCNSVTLSCLCFLLLFGKCKTYFWASQTRSHLTITI